jgi:hypothetical protein
MTKRTLLRAVVVTTTFYLVAIVVGVALRIQYPTKESLPYNTYKDLIPLLFAVPAAWLGFCFQRRSSYLQQLRALWPKIVEAVQMAIQYTHLTAPDLKEYSAVLLKLSIAIDEVRALFRNLNETDDGGGLYPFEPLKATHQVISVLGFGTNFDAVRAESARRGVVDLWKRLQPVFLHEFDREDPSRFASPFIETDPK